jgi:hypothetical protein
MRLRVAPRPASSRSARVSFRGCPVLRSLSAEPASDSLGCPSASGLRLCRRSPLEFPRTLMTSAPPVSAGFWVSPVAPTSSCCASDTGLRLPLVLYLRLYRRWIVESPRFTHLSAVPAVKVPGCPFPSHFRYRRRSVSGSPRMLILRHRLMGCPSHLGSLTIRFALADSPSFPGSSTLATTMTNFQVSLNLRSVAVRRFPLTRVAPSLCSSADPYLLSRVAPLPHLRLSR